MNSIAPLFCLWKGLGPSDSCNDSILPWLSWKCTFLLEDPDICNFCYTFPITNQHEKKKNPEVLFSSESIQYKETKADAKQGLAGHQNGHSSSFLAPQHHFHNPRADLEKCACQIILQSLAKSCLPSKQNPPLLRAPVLLCTPANLQGSSYRDSTLPRELGEAELVPWSCTLGKCAFNLINVWKK